MPIDDLLKDRGGLFGRFNRAEDRRQCEAIHEEDGHTIVGKGSLKGDAAAKVEQNKNLKLCLPCFRHKSSKETGHG